MICLELPILKTLPTPKRHVKAPACHLRCTSKPQLVTYASDLPPVSQSFHGPSFGFTCLLEYLTRLWGTYSFIIKNTIKVTDEEMHGMRYERKRDGFWAPWNHFLPSTATSSGRSERLPGACPLRLYRSFLTQAQLIKITGRW